MITVTESVDCEEQTITWYFAETPPEHNIDGRMCHAIDEAVLPSHTRRRLGLLGYELVATSADFMLSYWARPE